VEISPASTFTSLCREQFAAAIDKGPLKFAAGRADIDSPARAMLDSLNETAADCATWHIMVRARGDRSSGADDRLQTARAQSIIDYLTDHGLARQRIAVATDAASAADHYGQAVFSVNGGNSDSAQVSDATDAHNSDGSTATTAAPLAD
jgi:hypothetical protein